MVMKVTSFNNVIFKSSVKNEPVNSAANNTNGIKDLGYVTPDFGVSTPVKYTKTKTETLSNGLKIHNYNLSNGYKVAIVPMEGSPSVVKTYVNVGSMNETGDIKGISHFLEHMAFNGTNGQNGHIELKTGDSFKKIDKLGGWANASTNYAITDYVNSAPLLENKDLETQIKVIAAMTEDLKLSEDMIKKEKGPVSSEINMILDDAQTVAMDQTVRTLFNIKNPADELVGGSVEHIKNLTGDDVVNYYNKYYTPDNIKIVITGDVNPDEAIELISKNFNSHKISKGNKYEEKITPINKTIRKDFISDKTNSANIVLGFAGPKNNETKEKILLDIASAYLMSHEAGIITSLKEYNTIPLIDNEKISTNPNSNQLIYLAMTPSEENSEKALKTLFHAIANVKPVTEDVANRLKQRIKQSVNEIMEHSSAVNDLVGYSLLDNNLDYVTEYDKILDSITADEINKCINKYFDLNKTAITVVHPSNNKTEVSFKGSQERVPVNTENLSRYKLKNNYDAGFYKTKSGNIDLSMDFLNNIPYHKKAGVLEVLNEVFTMGSKSMPEEEFNNFKAENNLRISLTCGYGGLNGKVGGTKDNYLTALNTFKELLYNPNITEETIAKAKSNIKDNFNKTQKTAKIISDEFDRYMNPFAFTRKEIVNNLDNISVDDVKELHKYMLKNCRGTIGATIPFENANEVKSGILDFASSLKPVEPNKYVPLEIYRERIQPVVLTSINSNSQADISQVFTYKRDLSDNKEKVVSQIMNSILTSSSIGLFDILREKENLAYSVYSDIKNRGNQGQISLNILTTTDNKNIGEYSYNNIEKSINGFNRQIGELIKGSFTDEDLNNAKRSLKAKLLNNEGSEAKLSTLDMGLAFNESLDIKNKIYSEIDNVTKEDIINFAKKAFSGNPVYSITASQDSLNANKEFLENLKTI